MADRDPYASIGTIVPTPARTPAAGRRFAPGGNVANNPAPATRFRQRPANVEPESAEAYAHMWQDLPPEQARQAYTRGRQRVEALARNNPTQRTRLLAQYNQRPATQALRILGGLQRYSTPRASISEVARKALGALILRSNSTLEPNTEMEGVERRADAARINFAERAYPTSPEVQGPLGMSDRPLLAGIGRGMFGIPERVEAVRAGEYGTRPRRTSNRRSEEDRARAAAEPFERLTYDERLAALRASRDRTMAQNPVAGFVGQVGGNVLSGLGALGVVRAVGGAAASSASPIISRGGNFLQNLTRLERGGGGWGALRNVGRVSLGGAAGGGAQAAGEGGNVLEGATIGAVAAPVFHGAVRLGSGAARGVRNILGFEPVEQILARYVQTPPAQIQSRMNARAAKGLPSSIYEVLPLRDRQALDDALARMPAKARERTAALVQQRAGNMARETSEQTRRIINPRADTIRAEIANDLAASRGGGAPTPEEIALAHRASRSPLDMEDVADAEARNIMRPYDDREAYTNVSELLPQHPVQRGATTEMVADDPDVASMIRSASGTLRIADRPVTVRDITAIMSTLSRTINRSSDHIERGTADRAMQHLEDILARDHPDVLPAVTRMREAYASRMRMMEGVTEGAQGRLRENVDPSSTRASRTARNAYDTPEGSSGRTLGQAGQLERDLGGSPDTVIRNLGKIATDPTRQRAISENLGDATAGENIADVAREQTRSARRLAGLDKEAAEEGGTDGVHVMQNLMMLSPNTLPSTKAFALSRLVSGAIRIPERQARSLVNMLFSQNPTQISRAVGMLERMGGPGRSVVRDIATGAFLAPDNALEVVEEEIPVEEIAVEEEIAPENPDEALPEEEITAEETMVPVEEALPGDAPAPETGDDPYEGIGSLPRGRRIIESVFPGVHVTDSARDPDSRLGRANPGSRHIHSNNAVDVRPIRGMTFNQFIQRIRDAGYEIVESRDEVTNPTSHATGPHWHVVIG